MKAGRDPSPSVWSAGSGLDDCDGGVADHELGEEPTTGVSPEEKLKEPDMCNRRGQTDAPVIILVLLAGQQAVLLFQFVERKSTMHGCDATRSGRIWNWYKSPDGQASQEAWGEL